MNRSLSKQIGLATRTAVFVFILLSSMLWFDGWTLSNNALAQLAPQSTTLLMPIVIDSPTNIYISEFMASNAETLTDEDSASPDWIELHNPTSAAIELSGWYLTDDLTNLTRWRFPATLLQPDTHLVVMASGKDRAITGQELHTNFKLAQGGEHLALVHPNGRTIISAYDSYEQQYQDRSFGIDAIDFRAQLLAEPTPGRVNSMGFPQSDLLVDVYHEPNTPAPGESLTIVAAIAQPAQNKLVAQSRMPAQSTLAQSTPVSVTLNFRIMYDDEIQIQMRDDGTQGDAIANDGVYVTVIEADLLDELANPGEMIRYAVTILTANGAKHHRPPYPSPTDSAQYFGTIIADAGSQSQQPLLHWFTEKPAWAYTREGTRSSLYFDGVFYENIWAQVRGGISTSYPKKGLKFLFNHSQPFTISVPKENSSEPDTAESDKIELQVHEFNLSTTYSDKTYIRQPLAFDAYRDAGVPAPISFPVRVEQNGEFHMVSIFVEQPDEAFLERNDLDPKGALYKMFNQLVPQRLDKVEKKTRQEEGNEDLLALATGLTTLEDDALAQFLADNLNLPEVINYLALSNVIQQNDHMSHNYYLYRDSEDTGLWSILPWDEDFTFGRSLIFVEDANEGGSRKLTYLQDEIWATNESAAHPLFGGFEQTIYRNGNYLYDAILRTPQTRALYLRRLRTLIDQFWQPPETPVEERYFETRIDDFQRRLAADIALDMERWPVMWGTPQTFDEAIDILKRDYLDVRRSYLYSTHVAEHGGLLPLPQSTEPAVTFGHFHFNEAGMINADSVAGTSIDPSQDIEREHEFFTLVNSTPDAIDLSGWQVTQNEPSGTHEKAGIAITLAPGTVIPANGTLCVPANAATYRHSLANSVASQNATDQSEIRCLATNAYRGSLRSRAGMVTLQNSTNQIIEQANYVEASPHMNQLVISELNYNPALDLDGQGRGYEFVELTNISTQIINIGNFRFTAGIDYTFPEGGRIAPGESIVIVEDIADFNRRYRSTEYASATVLGPYQGKLRNQGETLTLVDQNGRLITLLTYRNELDSLLGAAGEGYTLNRRAPWLDDHIACSWTASSEPLGTPGVHDAITEAFVCGAAAYLPFMIGQ